MIVLKNRPPLLIQAAAVNDTETLLLFLQYNIDMTVTHGNVSNEIISIFSLLTSVLNFNFQ